MGFEPGDLWWFLGYVLQEGALHNGAHSTRSATVSYIDMHLGSIRDGEREIKAWVAGRLLCGGVGSGDSAIAALLSGGLACADADGVSACG